jgi:hypothetical protein
VGGAPGPFGGEGGGGGRQDRKRHPPKPPRKAQCTSNPLADYLMKVSSTK